MSRGDEYKRLVEEADKNKEPKKSLNPDLLVAGAVVVVIVLFIMAVQVFGPKSEEPRSYAETWRIFMTAWRDWDVEALDSVIETDFYATNTLWSRDASFDWMEQRRPVSWDFGDGKAFGDMISLNIVTQDGEELSLLAFTELYSDGYRISGFRD